MLPVFVGILHIVGSNANVNAKRSVQAFLEGDGVSADICTPFVFPTAHISLDPRTSHPKLLLSEDYQQARFSYKWQKSPDNPQRFDRATCVLAHGAP